MHKYLSPFFSPWSALVLTNPSKVKVSLRLPFDGPLGCSFCDDPSPTSSWSKQEVYLQTRVFNAIMSLSWFGSDDSFTTVRSERVCMETTVHVDTVPMPEWHSMLMRLLVTPMSELVAGRWKMGEGKKEFLFKTAWMEIMLCWFPPVTYCVGVKLNESCVWSTDSTQLFMFTSGRLLLNEITSSVTISNSFNWRMGF